MGICDKKEKGVENGVVRGSKRDSKEMHDGQKALFIFLKDAKEALPAIREAEHLVQRALLEPTQAVAHHIEILH